MVKPFANRLYRVGRLGQKERALCHSGIDLTWRRDVDAKEQFGRL
jgi:hypothetical protein